MLRKQGQFLKPLCYQEVPSAQFIFYITNQQEFMQLFQDYFNYSPSFYELTSQSLKPLVPVLTLQYEQTKQSSVTLL